MPAARRLENENPLAVWGSELRHYRTRAQLSQEELSAKTSYSTSMISAVETGRRMPSVAMAMACDEALETGGALMRLWRTLLSQSVLPVWFRPWRDVEEEAVSLACYQALVVPGLLQTERYARALLGGDEAAVAARLERQRILTREYPPSPTLRCLIDEGALRRPVGDNPTMLEQLEYLATASMSARISIQIVPYGVYTGVQGSCVLAVLARETVGYLETATHAVVVSGRDEVAEISEVLDAIRADALPRQASTEFIRELAEQWRT